MEGYKHKTTLGEKTSGLSERTTSITLGQLRGADQATSSNISNRLTSDSSSSRYNLSFDVKRKHFDGQVHQQQQQQKWILCSPSAEGGVRAVHQLHRQQRQWKELWHQQQLWQQWQAFLVRCRRLKWRQVFLSFKTSQSFALQLKWRKVPPQLIFQCCHKLNILTVSLLSFIWTFGNHAYHVSLSPSAHILTFVMSAYATFQQLLNCNLET